MMDVVIRKPPIPAVYWADPPKGIMFFYLVCSREEVEVQHRTDFYGFSKRIVPIDELTITGITWESVLISVYRLFSDMKHVRELDSFAYMCEWVSRIIEQSWRDGDLTPWWGG